MNGQATGPAPIRLQHAPDLMGVSTMIGDDIAAPPAAPAPPRDDVRRAIAVWACIVLACLALIASVVGIWAHNLLFDSDAWGNKLRPIVRDPATAAALADRISADLVVALRIEDRARERLPDRAGFLAPALAESARDVLDRRLESLFRREAVQDLWLRAVLFAHGQVVAILRDQSTAIQTENGYVVLNLMPLIGLGFDQVNEIGLLPERFQLLDLRDASPAEGRQTIEQTFGVQLSPTFGTIPLAEARRLEQARGVVRWFDRLVVILPIVALALGALAFVITRRRLRTALELGAAVAVSFLVARLLIELIQHRMLEAVRGGGDRLVIAEALANAVTSGLKQVTAGLAVAGVVVVVLAVLADQLRWFDRRPATTSPEPDPA